MDKVTFVKRWAIWGAVIVALIIALIGVCFGKQIETTLFGEISKWIVMGLVIIGILEGFWYFLGPLTWHFTYGKMDGKEEGK